MAWPLHSWDHPGLPDPGLVSLPHLSHVQAQNQGSLAVPPPSGHQERRPTPELPAQSTPGPRGQDVQGEPGAHTPASRHQRALWVRDGDRSSCAVPPLRALVPQSKPDPRVPRREAPWTLRTRAFVVAAAVSKSFSTRGARGPAESADISVRRPLTRGPRRTPYACAALRLLVLPPWESQGQEAHGGAPTPPPLPPNAPHPPGAAAAHLLRRRRDGVENHGRADGTAAPPGTGSRLCRALRPCL